MVLDAVEVAALELDMERDAVEVAALELDMVRDAVEVAALELEIVRDELEVAALDTSSEPGAENADASVELKASAESVDPSGSAIVCPGALAKAKREAPEPAPLTSAQLRGPGRYVRKTSDEPAGVQGQ